MLTRDVFAIANLLVVNSHRKNVLPYLGNKRRDDPTHTWHAVAEAQSQSSNSCRIHLQYTMKLERYASDGIPPTTAEQSQQQQLFCGAVKPLQTISSPWRTMMGLHTKFGSSACVKLLPDSRRIAQNTHSLPLPSSAPFLVPFISFPCLTFPISSPFLLSRPLVLSPCSLPPFPCPPLPVVYRGLRISSTSGIRGTAPAANEFLTILTPGNTFGDNIFSNPRQVH